MRNGRVRGLTPPGCVHTRPASNSAATSTRAGAAPPPAALGRSAPPAGVDLRGDVEEGGVGSSPGVVEQVGALGADRPSPLGAPGVDADDEARVGGADPGDEADHAAALLLDVDLGSGRRLDPADVD